MRFVIKKILLFSFILLGLFNTSFAQEDGFIELGDIEYVDGAYSEQDSSEEDEFIPVPDDMVFTDGNSSIDQVNSTDPEKNLTSEDSEKQSMWGIFIAGLLGGFAAFIMPCIFPMVPLTVSFFTKRSDSKIKAVSQALLYGIFIIVIYVALGMLITIAFGSNAPKNEAANSTRIRKNTKLIKVDF